MYLHRKKRADYHWRRLWSRWLRLWPHYFRFRWRYCFRRAPFSPRPRGWRTISTCHSPVIKQEIHGAVRPTSNKTQIAGSNSRDCHQQNEKINTYFFSIRRGQKVFWGKKNTIISSDAFNYAPKWEMSKLTRQSNSLNSFTLLPLVMFKSVRCEFRLIELILHFIFNFNNVSLQIIMSASNIIRTIRSFPDLQLNLSDHPLRVHVAIDPLNFMKCWKAKKNEGRRWGKNFVWRDEPKQNMTNPNGIY